MRAVSTDRRDRGAAVERARTRLRLTEPDLGDIAVRPNAGSRGRPHVIFVIGATKPRPCAMHSAAWLGRRLRAEMLVVAAVKYRPPRDDLVDLRVAQMRGVVWATTTDLVSEGVDACGHPCGQPVSLAVVWCAEGRTPPSSPAAGWRFPALAGRGWPPDGRPEGFRSRNGSGLVLIPVVGPFRDGIDHIHQRMSVGWEPADRVGAEVPVLADVIEGKPP